ncbi:unnamed protein product, partial [Rotaria sp. Silwood2]
LPISAKLFIPSGSILDIQSVINTTHNGGCRCYLVILGGIIDVPIYLNSKSTFISCNAGDFGLGNNNSILNKAP